jgi:transcriptional regulator with XRE-family HTH domain
MFPLYKSGTDFRTIPKSRGLTQEAAANHSGGSRPTFIAIEKGTQVATSEEIVKLAELYGGSVHEIVRTGPAPVALEPHLRAAIGSTNSNASKDVELSIADLQAFANDYLQLESLTGAQAIECYPPEISVPRVQAIEFAEDVAARERARLNLGNQPIGDLRSLLEESESIFGSIPRIMTGPVPFGTTSDASAHPART